MDEKDVLALVAEQSHHLHTQLARILSDYRIDEQRRRMEIARHANDIVKYRQALQQIQQLGDLSTTSEAKRIAGEALQ